MQQSVRTLRRGAARRPVVIAHRGASGYLPEHTLEAKALACGQGADYLEQDVVASRDGQLFVLHDLYLERVTDVAERFPARRRADGHWYVLDFDTDELRGLKVTERLQEGNPGVAVYTARFPPHTGSFRLHTLDEEIALVQGLMHSTSRRIGVYPEIKAPAWHRQHGVDLGAAVVDCLRRHGWSSPDAPAFLQCADPGELRWLREAGCELPMVQLVDSDPTPQGDWGGRDPLSPAGLRAVRAYAQGIGPWLGHVLRGDGDTGLTARAHAAGLLVHPWTLRRDELPAGWHSFDALNRTLFATVGVDGVFSDFPDRSVAVRDALFPR